MRSLCLLSTALATLTLGLCAPTQDRGCTNPLVRKEWRSLSAQEKHVYIDAVKCLASQPSQNGNLYKGAKSRFDDFQISHIVNTDFIHYVGFFQAWHRVFIAQYEKDLRDLCCYTGAQPYWNSALDSTTEGDFITSPVFDKEAGFGGNGVFVDTDTWTNITRVVPGRKGGGCVIDGPFAKCEFTVNSGPGNSTTYNPRCLTRDIAPEYAISKLNQTMIDWTLEAEDFFEFDKRVQGGVSAESQGYHGGGHLAIGGALGEMGDMYSSPGDPLFFLHHTNVDRLWDTWQRLDWPVRKSEISGPDTQYAYPYNFFGDRDYNNITLDYVMDFGSLIPGRQHVAVKEVMDTRDGLLCYIYQ